MPRFLFPEAPSLNDLIAPKRIVNRRNKRKYQSVEPNLDQAPNQSPDGASFIKKLTAFQALMNEILNQLFLTQQAGYASQAIDRYISAVSGVTQLVNDLDTQFVSMNNSLNQLSQAQVAQVAKIWAKIVDANVNIEAHLQTMPAARSARLRALFLDFEQELKGFSDKLDGALNNYKMVGGGRSGGSSLVTFGHSLQHLPRRFL